ncbi:hypothetical protein R50912_08245 [Paenibacillus sp. FSL R5-0912]|nr:hypothetical protein R50912_08245 [Paenibacillus sp. FSL R5-0912]
MKIRALTTGEQPPRELLLSADPSPKLVDEYTERGHCFVAEADSRVIGVYEALFENGIQVVDRIRLSQDL